MPTTDFTIETLRREHVSAAVGLSRAAGWPHRAEDWAFVARLSVGSAVLAQDGRLVGTAFMTPFGETLATINMVIVDEMLRGQGIGRRLMQRCLDAAGGRTCHLVATAEGLPLYEKLGFRRFGEVVQHQGIVRGVQPKAGPLPPGTRLLWPAGPEMEAACAALDRAASGVDRAALVSSLFEQGQIACLLQGEKTIAYAALRAFGRGEVAGPIVAPNQPIAAALLGLLIAECDGRFLRVDTTPEMGLIPQLEAHGLMPVGGGIRMRRGREIASSPDHQIFALASQALG
jgi:predicted N-acetyltransferase YhbS